MKATSLLVLSVMLLNSSFVCSKDTESFGSNTKGATCKTKNCDAGQICEMRQVECFAAPCFPVPECVPTTMHRPSCATTNCDFGQICQMQQVQCFAAPCFPIPECIQVSPMHLRGRFGKRSSCANVRCAGICVMERRCPMCRKVPRCKPIF